MPCISYDIKDGTFVCRVNNLKNSFASKDSPDLIRLEWVLFSCRILFKKIIIMPKRKLPKVS